MSTIVLVKGRPALQLKYSVHQYLRFTLIIILFSEVSCGEPGDIKNGTKNGKSYLYQDQVTYTCNDGYGITTGDAVRTCGENRTWSGKKPECGRNHLYYFIINFCQKRSNGQLYRIFFHDIDGTCSYITCPFKRLE